MELCLELDKNDYVLEIDVTSPGYFEPASIIHCSKTGGLISADPGYGEDPEYKVVSAYADGYKSIPFSYWKSLEREDKEWLNKVIMKAKEVARNELTSDDEGDIVEAIDEYYNENPPW